MSPNDPGRTPHIPAALADAIALMETTARSERDIAATLQEIAAEDEGEAAARRRSLAGEAVRGAEEADKRCDQLALLARQWAEREDVRALQQLLDDAVRVLGTLARLQQAIADTFTSLSNQDGAALAAERQKLAATAAAAASDAREQARSLRELATASVARTHPHQ